MRQYLAGFILLWLSLAMWFPQSTGYVAHKVLNELKIGWESVR